MKQIYYISLLLLLSSCTTTNYSFTPNTNLAVYNKRLNQETIPIQNFIIPGQTSQLFPNSPPDKKLLAIIINYIHKLPTKKDPKDYWNYPIETIKNGGDCEDKAHLLASLLIFHGFKNVYAVKGEVQKNFFKEKEGHVWVELDQNEETYLIDPIAKRNYIQKKRKSSGYFPFFKYNNNNAYQLSNRKQISQKKLL